MLRTLASLTLLACAAAAEPDFLVGVCTHRGGEPDYLPLARQAGAMAIRDEVSWGACEKTKGVIAVPESYIAYVKRAKGLGLTTLNILDYANPFYDDGGYPRSPEAIEGFVRYSEAVVTALKGTSTYYQVWNEWDGGCGMPAALHRTGDPEAYVKLLAAVYPRIKAIDPSITVIANSVCTGDDFLKKTLAAGVLKHCDALALHTYNYSGERSTDAWHARMAGVDAFLREANAGKPVPLYITEMGWPNHVNGSGSTQERSALNLAQLYLLVRTHPYIKGLWWYDFRDDGWDSAYNENNFGIVRNDLSTKAPYFALKDVARLIDGATFQERIDAGDPRLWVLRFATARGTSLIAAWNSAPDDDWQLTLRLPGEAKRELALTSVGEGTVQRAAVAAADGASSSIRFSVRERPQVLEGELAKAVLAKAERRPFPESQRPVQGVFHRLGPVLGATPVGAAVLAPKAFGAPGDYVTLVEKLPRAGAADLDARLSASWDAKALHLTVAVTDDIHRQTWAGDSTWQGDGLQIAFHDGVPKEGRLAHVDLDVALTADGPAIWRRDSRPGHASGKADDLQAEIVREGVTTTYRLTLPWAGIGLPQGSADALVGMSLLVNDDDGGGRKGYLHWGDGIGREKDPFQYGWVLLRE